MAYTRLGVCGPCAAYAVFLPKSAGAVVVGFVWDDDMSARSFSQADAITKSDTVNFVRFLASGILTHAIWVGGAGVVVAVFEDGATCAFTCAAGSLLPVRAKRVNETSTTATLMVALYEL